MSLKNQTDWVPSSTIQRELNISKATVWRYGQTGIIRRRRIKRNWRYSIQDAKKVS